MNAVSEHGIISQGLAGKAMGDFGAIVVQGAASSSSDMYAQSLPARNVSAPPMTSICDASALEPQTGYSGTRDTSANNKNSSWDEVHRSLAKVPEAA